MERSAVDLSSLMTALPSEAEVEAGDLTKDVYNSAADVYPSPNRRGVGAGATPSHFQNSNSSQHSNVYVKNLAEDVDETSLKQMFDKFGVVESCCVIRDVSTNASRGFGFVKFQQVHQARQAISNMNGYNIRGRSLEVKFANSDSTATGGPGNHGVGTVSDNVYVKGLPPKWSERDLRDFFSSFGVIIECRLLHASGTTTAGALIRFETVEQAIRAVVTANNVVPVHGSVPLVMRFADSHGKGPGGRSKLNERDKRDSTTSRGSSVSNADEYVYGGSGRGGQNAMSNVLMQQHNSVSLAMLQHQAAMQLAASGSTHGANGSMHASSGSMHANGSVHHGSMHANGSLHAGSHISQNSAMGSMTSMGSFGSLNTMNGRSNSNAQTPPLARRSSFHGSIDEGSAHDGRAWQNVGGSFGGSPGWGTSPGQFQGSPDCNRYTNGRQSQNGSRRRDQRHEHIGNGIGGLSAMFAAPGGGSMDSNINNPFGDGNNAEHDHSRTPESFTGRSVGSFGGRQSQNSGSANSPGSRGSSVRGGNAFGPGTTLGQSLGNTNKNVAGVGSPVGSFDGGSMWSRGHGIEAVRSDAMGKQSEYSNDKTTTGDLDRVETPGISAEDASAMLDRLETPELAGKDVHESAESETDRTLLVRGGPRNGGPDSSELFLYRQFAKHGAVVSIQSTGVAMQHVVTFGKAAEADEARRTLDGGALGELHVTKLGNESAASSAS